MRYFLAILVIFMSISQAEARKQRVIQQNPAQNSWDLGNPMGFSPNIFQTAQTQYSRASRTLRSYGNVQLVAHPSGCPRRAFCGCGAAVAVFGTPRRDLWLAANWLKFPRTSPAPGMVAARRGHVFVLRSQNSDGSWTVEDYNSGRGQSRIHTRSLSGYAIVNPRA